MGQATLTISSKNYSSWSLRAWLLTRTSGLPFEEVVVPITDPANRAELLLLSPSVLVPRLSHDGATVWGTVAIGEYLNEVRPAAGLLPADRVARAQCGSICGEMHSGFGNLRSALPMNSLATLNATDMFTSVVVLSAVGVALVTLIRRVERRLLPWAPEFRT